MERRKAFATAGAVSVTAIVVVVALGANVGLFGLTRHDDGPGQFKLVGSTHETSASDVRTGGVDAPAPDAPAPGVPTAGSSVAPAPAAPSVGSPNPYVDDSGPDQDSEPVSGDHDDD